MRTNGFQGIYSAFIIALSAGVAFAGPTDARKM